MLARSSVTVLKTRVVCPSSRARGAEGPPSRKIAAPPWRRRGPQAPPWRRRRTRSRRRPRRARPT